MIEDCYNRGNILMKNCGSLPDPACGGISAQTNVLDSLIKNCYNSGAVEIFPSDSSRCGSLIGYVAYGANLSKNFCWCSEGLRKLGNVKGGKEYDESEVKSVNDKEYS